MAAAVRNKSTNPRKGPALQDPNPTRRTTAWRGASNPPSTAYSPSPSNQSPRLAQQFPPLGAQQNGAAPDTPLPPPALIGSTIVVSTRSGQRYEGALVAVPAAADGDAALQLKDVKDLANPGAPLKDSVTLPAGSLANWSTSEAAAKANGDFRTDTDISSGSGSTAPRRERELQAWQPDESAPPPPSALGVRGDEATFGPGSNAPNGSWDQFEANEKMFGVTTSFDEDIYTTKIDRNTPDFKERERKAQALANEISRAATSNPHVAEERNLSVDDSGMNEEDKFAGVVRGANAYIPPGARRTGSGNSIPQAKTATSDIPQVSVTDASSTPASKTTSPPSTTSPPTKDLIPTFRDFVTNEKQRLTQKRQAIVKNEMDKRMSELVKFSQSFKLNKPIPEDLVAILAKDEDKQKQIREKSSRDAASTAARTIGVTHAANAPIPRAPMPIAAPQIKPAPAPAAAPTAAALKPVAQSTSKKDGAPARIPMMIQKIPPFNPNKGKGGGATPAENDKEREREAKERAEEKNDAAFKLNVNASSFKLKPNAPTFKPVVSTPSPKMKAAEPAAQTPAAPATPNPFFGTRVLKKGAPVHVKDDFNPFKHAAKVPDAPSVNVMWPYSGKRYTQIFPALPPPPAAPQPMQHIPPAGPPAPPPPPYEEDPAAQHARGGYGMVYAYAPYAYPGQPQQQQPMMAGGGPPGGYMPSPFLQPMHYPQMPPNGHQAMYAPPPSMGNMPPPQQYMQPPPPGAYPPPPNGAARGSMPPTPMPPHAHAYAYHQSPQLSHAVPYQMMMPPPPNGPPHGNYENGPPPVPMGGVGHG